MGGGSRIASVFLRAMELISASIVAGLVGAYLHNVSNAHDHANSKLVYTVALAGISILVSLVCIVPLDPMFYGFLLDAALFVMWMTAFGLQVGVSFVSSSHLKKMNANTMTSLQALMAVIHLGIGHLGAGTGVAGITIRSA